MGPQLAYRHFSEDHLVFPAVHGRHPRSRRSPAEGCDRHRNRRPTGAAGRKRDWQGFYGIGYGFDINLTQHFGIRTQGDLVWDHLFNDILAQGRWTTRFSVGPCFNFGRNIAAKP